MSPVNKILCDALECIKLVGELKTYGLGIEPNIHAGDYPIARIVLDRSERTNAGQMVSMTVYAGDAVPLHESKEDQTDAAAELELIVLNALRARDDWRVDSRGTTYDDSRVPGFKLAAIKVEICRVY